MATCPKCMGFLTENHRCPGGVWARVSKALLTVLVGGAIGIVGVYALVERPVAALVLAGAALGAVLSMAIRQAVGGRP
jgi:Zn-dependent protease